MSRNSHHVIPDPEGGWNVRRGGSARASKHFERQRDAIEWARQLSKAQQTELFIHRRDGTVREKDSYGQDPQALVDQE